ncbi:MAG: NUDIX hydrolase [Acidipropionibacterium jensenii]|uniref:NUDIX hydrolase n=1 Tax=Acidipropionibacterium jensenii TaxID=1749 RepID=UPI0026476121|nr:histidine phosphatase family protein [Acidipropionibacterium jensenii]MDN6442851.1 NUDIX hydrolase [Acidipropionibacterium jensenii]
MSRRKGPVLAAGAVVLRRTAEGTVQVLAVHRPRYDDISLPKGHQEPGEDSPVTAVREVLEETGVRIRLSANLQPIEYEMPNKMAKLVQWWVGTVCSEHPHEPDEEVDQAMWLDLAEARTRLSYATDVQVLEEAVKLPATTTIALVRHAKAISRKEWASGKHRNKTDPKRPLDRRGKRQAKALAALLEAYGVSRLVSSPATRCMQTLTPYAQAAGIEIQQREEFTEEAFEAHHKPTRKAMKELVAEQLADPDQPLAICGHRPVLPAMGDVLHSGNHPMATAECLVVHLSAKGKAIRQEWHRPSI